MPLRDNSPGGTAESSPLFLTAGTEVEKVSDSGCYPELVIYSPVGGKKTNRSLRTAIRPDATSPDKSSFIFASAINEGPDSVLFSNGYNH